MPNSIFRDFYDNIEILYINQENWLENIIKKIGFFEPLTSTPLIEIINYAKRIGGITILVEKDYVDMDFLEEYSSFYSKSFTAYSHNCVRLHFFNKKIEYKDFESLPNTHYLGFTILRPIHSFRTSRTVLNPYFKNHDKNYITCKTEFESNISGNKLTISGMPYIQQDTNVNVCAEAAIWMAALFMHKKYSFNRFTPPEITECATKYYTVGPTRDGLTVDLMLAALREMGYQALSFHNYSTKLFSLFVYSYIESEIPVILTLKIPNVGGHAITAIGHDFDINLRFKTDFKNNANLINGFYYHDDASGPYKYLPIANGSAHADYTIARNVNYAIVPIFKEVILRIDDVIINIKKLMKLEILNELINLFTFDRHIKFKQNEISNLVYRIYLKPSNCFKTSLSNEMPPIVRLKYKSMRMPKYIWVVEISKPKYIKKIRSSERKIIGEIIIDSTADRHLAFESFLSIHLLGRMIIRTPDKIRPSRLFFIKESPYPHLIHA